MNPEARGQLIDDMFDITSWKREDSEGGYIFLKGKSGWADLIYGYYIEFINLDCDLHYIYIHNALKCERETDVFLNYPLSDESFLFFKNKDGEIDLRKIE